MLKRTNGYPRPDMLVVVTMKRFPWMGYSHFDPTSGDDLRSKTTRVNALYPAKKVLHWPLNSLVMDPFAPLNPARRPVHEYLNGRVGATRPEVESPRLISLLFVAPKAGPGLAGLSLMVAVDRAGSCSMYL
jgi:hypothetical protein